MPVCMFSGGGGLPAGAFGICVEWYCGAGLGLGIDLSWLLLTSVWGEELLAQLRRADYTVEGYCLGEVRELGECAAQRVESVHVRVTEAQVRKVRLPYKGSLS